MSPSLALLIGTWSRLNLSWLDVLVEPQHIVGIILLLDLHQPSIVWAVCRPHKLFARFAQLVDVHATRKRLQIVAQRLDPLHRTRFLCGNAPSTHHVDLVTRLPQSESHVTGCYTRNRAVKRHKEHLVVRWRIVGCRCYPRHRARGKLRKEQVGLKMRD